MAGITYVGNCEWEQRNIPQPERDARGGGRIVVLYMGRIDKMAQFASRFRIGQSCSYELTSGIENKPGYTLTSIIPSESPDKAFGFLSLTYQGYEFNQESQGERPEDRYLERTVARTLTISKDLSPPVAMSGGFLATKATRDIVYETQEAYIETFTTTKPSENVGKTPTTSAPRIIRSRFTVEDSEGNQKVLTGSVSAALLSQFEPKEEVLNSGMEIEQIPGTPWWKATYSKAREYVEQ